MFWLDAADTQPNTASGGCVQWRLTAIGKAGHSGSVSSLSARRRACQAHIQCRLPHKAINAIELANDCLLGALLAAGKLSCFAPPAEIQRRMLDEDFPPCEKEKEYALPCPSSLKPTNIAVPAGPATVRLPTQLLLMLLVCSSIFAPNA